MVKEINSYPLITGYRGSKPKDEEVLIQIIKNICKMFMEQTDLKEFDVNPIRLYDSGACAVDARIILDSAPGVPPPDELNRNFLGALFKAPGWEPTGAFSLSRTSGSHANRLVCWRYVGEGR